MKVSCLSMVRNEADILDTFCRHLSALFDAVTIIDHGSTDGTREYLQAVAERDPRVHLYFFEEPAYEQAALMNFAVRNLPPLAHTDWLFLLDADEFLPFPNRTSFLGTLQALSSQPVIYMRWSNLIPDSYAWRRFEFATPVWRCDDKAMHRKIAFQPGLIAESAFWIAQGNHDLLESPGGASFGGQLVDFPLFHVPIRSVQQLSLKLAQGVAAYSLRDLSADRREGFHWANICDVSRNEGLDPELLNWLVINYGKPLKGAPDRASHEELPDLGYAKERLRIAETETPRAFSPLKSATETMLLVCTQFAADVRRTPPRGEHLQLKLDNMNRISVETLPTVQGFPALDARQWSTETFETLDDDKFLRSFLAPAFWPIKCLPGSAFAGHIPFLFCLVAALKPRRFVELGTHRGASFFAACQAAQRASRGTECIAIDLWEGDEHAGFYDESVFEKFQFQFQKHFADVGSFLRLPFDEAADRFEKSSIELLHIDGLHTYEAVRHDFETWKDRVTAEGVVIFHDINVHERDFGVWQLWEELRLEYPSLSFSHSHGLGVLCMGDSEQNPIVRLVRALQHSREQTVFFQWFFQNAGELNANRTRSKDELNAKARQLADVSAENAQLRLRVGQLEREVRDANAHCGRQLSAYERSASWRMTAPFRWLTTALRRLLRKR